MSNISDFVFDRINVYLYETPLPTPFRISCGTLYKKCGIVFEVFSDGITGWGEAAVNEVPFYAHETVGSVLDVTKTALFPLLKGKRFQHPDEVCDLMEKSFRGAHFAKAALDAAAWDIYGQIQQMPVWKLLGGTRKKIEMGRTVSIYDDVAETLDGVHKALALGDVRIKIKIAPRHDIRNIAAIREHFPDIRLMVDANSAYTAADFKHLAELDRFHLQMMEQPLNESDIYCHSLLHREIHTPICLDESIHTLHDAKVCAALNAADIINIKICRVGGLTQSRRMHDICRENGIANWIGSRPDSGIANAPRLAAATLPNCIYPTDGKPNGSAGLMLNDTPPRQEGHFLLLPQTPGLGLQVNREKLMMITTAMIVLK